MYTPSGKSAGMSPSMLSASILILSPISSTGAKLLCHHINIHFRFQFVLLSTTISHYNTLHRSNNARIRYMGKTTYTIYVLIMEGNARGKLILFIKFLLKYLEKHIYSYFSLNGRVTVTTGLCAAGTFSQRYCAIQTDYGTISPELYKYLI